MKKKSLIYIIILIPILAFCAFYLNPTAITNRKIEKIYNNSYQAYLDSCNRWQGTLSHLPKNTKIANSGENYSYQAILLEKYNTIDISKTQGFLDCCTCSDSLLTAIAASEKAAKDYLEQKYGADFYKNVSNESKSLNKKYKLDYFQEIIPNMIEDSYTRNMLNDTMEIGILNLNELNKLPFIFIVDTTYNSNYFTYESNNNQIVFYPTEKSSFEANIFLLPAININVFFDPSATDFPYQKYAFLTVRVDSKYTWEGGKYGIVKTDSVKAAQKRIGS